MSLNPTKLNEILDNDKIENENYMPRYMGKIYKTAMG